MAGRDDMDLMLYADDELGGDERAELETHLAAEAGDRAKVEGIGEVGEVMRTYLELETDRAEPRLEAMWGVIERRITANGAAEAAPARPAKEPARPPRPSLWMRLGEWLDAHRGHFLTGAVTAGAVAALVLVLRPPATEYVTVQAPPRADGPRTVTANPDVADMVVVKSSPTEVEQLEVIGGSGAVMTIPAEREGESDTTVIWVTPDEATMEGPI